MTTCRILTLTAHNVTNCEEQVTQSGFTDTSLSDYQLIFCTRKIKRVKETTNTSLVVNLKII